MEPEAKRVHVVVASTATTSTTSASAASSSQSAVPHAFAPPRTAQLLAPIRKAPEFHPTFEEWNGNPMEYIEKIRPLAEAAGICKIIPPASWRPPLSISPSSKFHTRLQNISLLEGATRCQRAFDLALRKYRFYLRLPQPSDDVDWYSVFRRVRSIGGRHQVSNWNDMGCTKEAYEAELSQYEDLVLRGIRADPVPLASAMQLSAGSERARAIQGVIAGQEGVQRALAARALVDKLNNRHTSSSSSTAKIAPGVRFWKYYDEFETSCQGVIRNPVNDGGEVRWRVCYTDPHGKDFFVEEDQSELSLALSCGATNEEATEAYARGVCQVCARAHLAATLNRCYECKSRFHSACLPAADQPLGGNYDWFCAQCRATETDELLDDFGFDDGPDFTLEEYRLLDEGFRKALVNACERQGQSVNTPEHWDALFWSLVHNYRPSTLRETREISVVYANDIDTSEVGSGFPTMKRLLRQPKRMERMPADAREQLEAYARHPWNLNNLPTEAGSLLQYIEADISGVIVPWLYVGMTMSAFCWHVEDHNFASINYLHKGEPKSWWGVSGQAADDFESLAHETAPDLFVARPDLLQGIVTMFSPWELGQNNVVHALQREGEYIVTFPRAYHCGCNHGLNIAEAVNFATRSWLPWGYQAVDTYTALGKSPVIAVEALLLTIAAKCATDAEFVSTAQLLVGPLGELVQRERRRRTQGLPRLWSEESPPPLVVAEARRAKGARQRYSLDMGRLTALANAFESLPRCSQCQSFCVLSHAVSQSEQGPTVLCLDHAPASAACFASHSLESLELLLDAVVERAERTSRFFERLDRILTGQKQPDDLLGPEFGGGEPLPGVLLKMPSLAGALRCLPLRAARRLLDLAKQAHVECAEEQATVDAAEQTLLRLEAVVPTKSTRSANMPSLQELQSSLAELDVLCIQPDVGLRERLEKELTVALAWQQKARSLVDRDLQDDDDDDDDEGEAELSLAELETFAAEARVDVPERAELAQLIARMRWMQRTNRVLEAFADDALGEAQSLLDSAPPDSEDAQAKLRQFVTDTQALAQDVQAIFNVEIQPNRLFEVFKVAGPRLPPDSYEHLRKHVNAVRSWVSKAEDALKQPEADFALVQKLRAQRASLKVSPDFAVSLSLDKLERDLNEWLVTARNIFCLKPVENPLDWDGLQNFLEQSWDRIDFPNRKVDDSGLYCTCRSPATPGRLMIQCEGACGQWFHPQCLKLHGIPEHFECKDCVDARTLHCVCRRPAAHAEVLVGCDGCEERWFHPQCVGLNKAKLKKLERFLCPVCTRAEGVPLVCICQQPLVANSAPTVKCVQCSRVFHCPCVRVSDKLDSFMCEACCNELDVPMVEGGKRGFDVKLKTLKTELARPLSFIKRPTVAQLEKLLALANPVTLGKMIQAAVDQAHEWEASTQGLLLPCPGCQEPCLFSRRGLELWAALDGSTKLRVQAPESLVNLLEGELLLRHVAKALPTVKPRISDVRAMWNLTGRAGMLNAYITALDAHESQCTVAAGLRPNLDRFTLLGGFEKKFTVALRKAMAASKTNPSDRPQGETRELLSKGPEVMDLGTLASSIEMLLSPAPPAEEVEASQDPSAGKGAALVENATVARIGEGNEPDMEAEEQGQAPPPPPEVSPLQTE